MLYSKIEYQRIKSEIDSRAENEEEKLVNTLFLDANFAFIDCNVKMREGNIVTGEIDGLWFHNNTLIIIEVKNLREGITRAMNHFFRIWSDSDNLEWLRQEYIKNTASVIRVFFDLKHNNPEKKASRRTLFNQNPKTNFAFGSIDFRYFIKQEELINEYVKFDILYSLNFQRRDTSIIKPCLKNIINGQEFLITTLPVKTLLEICYVTRKKELSSQNGYQRMLQDRKLREIYGELLSGESITFPNSIIVTPSDGKEIQTEDDTNYGSFPKTTDVSIPSDYCSLRIVDGQHRLYGFSRLNLDLDDEKILLNEHLVVIILNRLQRNKEVSTFIKINSTSSRVNPNLLETLKLDFRYPVTHKYYDDKIAVQLARKLNETNGSPYKGKIDFGIIEDQLSEEEKPIKLKTLVSQFKNNKIIGRNNIFGVERTSIQDYYDRILRVLVMMEMRDETKEFILENRGIRIFFRLFALAQRNINHNFLNVGLEQAFTEIQNLIISKGIEQIYEYGEAGAVKAANELIRELKSPGSVFENMTDDLREIPLS